MSKPTMITAECPNCHAEITIPYYEELNVSEHPEQKEAILSGDFFKFTCPKCGAVLPVTGPLLYHDPKVPTMLQLVPPGFDDATERLDELLALIQGMEGDKTSLYQARLVTSVDKLLEKIYIQDAGLDDRVVELVKLAYLKHYGPQLQAKGKIHAALYMPSDEGGDAQIVFVLGDSGEMASIDFSKDYYVYFATEFAKALEEASSVNQFHTIDEAWAAEFLRAQQP